MYRFALSSAAVLTLAISGSLSAAELTAPRDIAPEVSSSIDADRFAMHDNMHKHMDDMKSNMQQPAPQQPAPAHPGGNLQPADPHASPAKPADPSNPGAAHAPSANSTNPPAHSAQPPASKGMKHM